MERVSMEKLNKTDDPKSFGGELIADDGTNQLWRFGGLFANRREYLSEDGRSVLEIEWDGDVRGWDPDGTGMLAVD